ncbi:MAG: glycoside hydrolase family 127 protein [Clostridia bacterium]|nr:glycoside hydrolase family 127 protein [Clostridia bacterium]
MDRSAFSTPLPLKDFKVSDAFWQREMDLVRREVIPYQWEALNDRVPGAAPSWWMHNMRAAARVNALKRAGKAWEPPAAAKAMRFEPLPEKGQEPDADAFYGFVFQDSDGYKWLEAVSYQLMLRPDPELQARAQEAVDAICAAQEPDGYLDTYYTLGMRGRAFTNLRDHHELYCLGHLCEAAVAWHQATGRTDLLDCACRYADCAARSIGPEEGKKHGYPGHEIAEMALIRLWQETGEERFLRQAAYFLDERGRKPHWFAIEEAERNGWDRPNEEADFSYHQAHLPVRGQSEVMGHAVRAMYLCSGMADMARLTGDEEMRAACERLWQSTAEEKRYVTGGVGATHVGEAFSRPYDLPSDTAYSETCAAIGLAFFARRMLQMEPDSRYADVMEEAVYNTVLAGMALDGKSFFYVNPLESDPGACRTDRRLEHVKPIRQKWFGCACCPPNIARLVSSMPQYAFTANDDTLFLHLYMGGELTVRLNGRTVRLEVASDLPWHGNVRLTVLEGDAEGTIAMRLPGWCRHYGLETDRKQTEVKNGYACLTGRWQTGDTVELALDMPVRAVGAHPLVRELAGQVCVKRGPIVYCAEGHDNAGPLHLWRIDPTDISAAAEEETKVCGTPAVILRVPALRTAVEDGRSLYDDWSAPEEARETLTLIPYFMWDNRGENAMCVWFRT